MPAIQVKRILYLAHDQLHRKYGVLKNADPQTDAVVLVESRRMVTGRPWHPERLFLILSAARHFAQELQSEGFSVEYIKAESTVDGLRQAHRVFGSLPIFAAEASSHRQLSQLGDFGIQWVENDFFVTSRKHFEEWAKQQKSFKMENFYRAQRLRLGILVEAGNPVGGQWNFDEDNRLPPPKNHEWPKPLEFDRDDIDLEVANELGHKATRTWATTRAGAIEQLKHFVNLSLDHFGPYEDAVSKESWSMHHSLLSPYLNLGLLNPREVVAAVLREYHEGRARLESVEAIIRQIIGWREYINGMYWHLGEDYKNLNALDAQRSLPPMFGNSSKTKMNCMSSVLGDVEKRGWTHHIPRLMLLSNLALTAGVRPQEFLDWMREQFVDAADWVMVPNIIGMATYADGGKLMTKPYAAGGAYVSRMTEYCKGCAYNPKERTGETACPLTTLYWDFIDRNSENFRNNHRMFRSIQGLQRLEDRPALALRAKVVLQRLSDGTL